MILTEPEHKYYVTFGLVASIMEAAGPIQLTVFDVLEMQAQHVVEHVKDIQAIRQACNMG